MVAQMYQLENAARMAMGDSAIPAGVLATSGRTGLSGVARIVLVVALAALGTGILAGLL